MKKFISILLLVTLITNSLLLGCSNSEKKISKSDNSKENSKVKLEILRVSSGSNLPPKEEDFVKQTLEEKLNIDMDLQLFASSADYKNQLNVRLAGGNPPDFMEITDKPYLIKLAKQGMLLDISSYKDQLNECINFLGEDSLKKSLVNGKSYALVKAPPISFTSYWIRKDWLDNLGLEMPTNFDELYEVLIAFTENDPDGNNKKDTYGLSGALMTAFCPILGGYGLPSVNQFYVKNGKITNSLYEEQMPNALEYIKKLIKADVVDPELMTNNGTQHRDKAIQGKVGMVFADWPNMTKDQFTKQMKDVNPNVEWCQLNPPKGPIAEYTGSFDIGMSSGLMAIPKALSKKENKLQALFDLVNYLATDEGSLLVQYGIKDKHFTIENDKVVPKELMFKECGYTWLYQFLGRPELKYLTTKFAPQKEAIEFANNTPNIEVLNGFIDPPDFFNVADAQRYIDEEVTKFIYDQRPLEEYDEFIETLNTTFKFKDYFDHAVKTLNELGYGK